MCTRCCDPEISPLIKGLSYLLLSYFISIPWMKRQFFFATAIRECQGSNIGLYSESEQAYPEEWASSGSTSETKPRRPSKVWTDRSLWAPPSPSPSSSPTTRARRRARPYWLSCTRPPPAATRGPCTTRLSVSGTKTFFGNLKRRRRKKNQSDRRGTTPENSKCGRILMCNREKNIRKLKRKHFFSCQ